MAEFTYEVTEEIGILSERTGWTKELNLVSFNGRDAKYDIREWSPGKAKMGKGVTLTKEELVALKELLDKMDL